MVKRYDPIHCYHSDGVSPGEMERDDKCGDYVVYEDYAALKKERDRLLVLATKHCDTSHHDWDEILTIAND